MRNDHRHMAICSARKRTTCLDALAASEPGGSVCSVFPRRLSNCGGQPVFAAWYLPADLNTTQLRPALIGW